jgi:hypothetical protein
MRLVLVCALGILLVSPQAAAGGGWWSYIDVNRSLVAPGQRVELQVTVSFKSAAAAEAAQQTDRFHVYLLRGFDDSVVERAMRKSSPGNWWSLGDAEAIDLAHVTVRVSDTNLGWATAAFTVPQLPPATYRLMLCDTACTKPLADVIPTEDFTVVADPATAQMAKRVGRLGRRSQNQAGQLAAARDDANKALSRGADRPLGRGATSSLGCRHSRTRAGVRRRPPLGHTAGGWLPGRSQELWPCSSIVAAGRDRRHSPRDGGWHPATKRSGSSWERRGSSRRRCRSP